MTLVLEEKTFVRHLPFGIACLTVKQEKGICLAFPRESIISVFLAGK